MITISSTNDKVIKDPLFLSARKFMKDRIAALEAVGPSKELDLAKQRYTGLTHADVVIEPAVTFANGITRVCFVSRTTGFLRGDAEVHKVPVKEVYDEFGVDIKNIGDLQSLISGVKAGTITECVGYVAGDISLIVNVANFNTKGLVGLMKDIFWDKTTLDQFPQMDPTSKQSGTFKFEAVNIDPQTCAVYVIEDIKGIV